MGLVDLKLTIFMILRLIENLIVKCLKTLYFGLTFPEARFRCFLINFFF